MERLAAIEQQISQLNKAELAQFWQWFADFDNTLRDAQIERDAAAGKLDALAQRALGAHLAGQTTRL
jgi:hypothetical protein